MDIYLISDFYDGFYTAVFYGFKKIGCAITSDKNVQLSLTDRLIEVTPEKDKAQRVRSRIYSYDGGAIRFIDRILRSDGKDKETAALDYIRVLIERKKPIGDMYADPRVFRANDYVRKVGWEIDKMYGLLRFKECAGGILYAPYEPDCDITELIARHFSARLPKERFIIHDVKRKKAFIYNRGECAFAPLDKAEIYLSDDEEEFEKLWKRYYDSVNISLRPHEKQMKGYMPVRYWKYLPEKN